MYEEKAKNLKKYLPLIRACAGWSAADLASRLGVTRSQVSNMENSDSEKNLTTMQYLAIRQVLDQEIRQSDEEGVRMLADVIKVLVDEPENYTDEQRNQVLADAKLLAPSILAQREEREEARRKASMKWAAVLAGSCSFLAGIAAGSAITTVVKNLKK